MTIATLEEFCDLEYQLELSRRKGYYDYLIQGEDVDTSIEVFFEAYASYCKYYKKLLNNKLIQEFEKSYNIKLPKDLQQFYEIPS